MVKAVMSQSVIRPLEPLPADWQEGQPVRVEADDREPTVEEIDRDFAALERLCAASDPADEERLEQAVWRHGAWPRSRSAGSGKKVGVESLVMMKRRSGLGARFLHTQGGRDDDA